MNTFKPAPGHQPSLWEHTFTAPSFAPLEGSITVDVCVVGAGMAGLSVAYELASAGYSVAVVEAGTLGGGMTARTTAHISNALDDRYSAIERVLGPENARLAAQSHTAAIERIARIVRDEQIDCDLEHVDGFLFNPPREKVEVLQDEYNAAQRAGVNVEWETRVPFTGWNTGPALRFMGQAQFHPVKYLAGLAGAIQRRGGRIFTGTRATRMKGGDIAVIETDAGHIVKAWHLVVATNTPVNDRFVIHTKQASYNTSVIALRCAPGFAPRFLMWDTSQKAGETDSYHYIRSWHDAGGDFLIVGGEDHKTGQDKDPEAAFLALEDWTRARFPDAGKIEYRWAGQVFEPLDGMAFIGRNPSDDVNVYVATGDSGNGITHGAIAGMLISNLIRDQLNPWESLYDPGRIIAKTIPDFLRENLNVVAQLRDYATPGDVSSAENVRPGTGAVIRDGVHKLAVFRDDDGTLHRHSAVCPHLKCIVRWNSAERTWDCPCHGSRFDAYGKVIMGPANSDLEAVDQTVMEPAVH
ncbi:MAG TPA: FAD-dependent oxidoreductase [Verrucomicrobiales bacterium]|nr:FAD-dependent oxidoreductase [Verrucomicrobiales bacterium]